MNEHHEPPKKGRREVIKGLVSSHNPGRTPHVFFFSHPLDETGAPQALLLAVQDFAEHMDPNSIHVVFPSATESARRRFSATGVTMNQISARTSVGGMHLRLGLRATDFVLINTLAVPLRYFEYLVLRRSREFGYLWVHETSAKYLEGDLANRAESYVASGSLKLYAPGRDGARLVGRRFGGKPVSVAYPFRHHEDMAAARRVPIDFASLHIALVGEYSSGRKGQILALLGLVEALKVIPPQHQRPLQVTLFAVAEDVPGTYHVANLRKICEYFLPGRFTILPPLERSLFLRQFSKTNVTVCSSRSESFPLFVVEGMKNFNVLIRNRVSGASEQLAEGINGFDVQDDSLEAYRQAFVDLVDKRRFTDENLAEMGNASRAMVDGIAVTNYWDVFRGAEWRESACVQPQMTSSRRA